MKIHLIDGTYELFRNPFRRVVTIRPTVFLEGFFLPLTGPSVRNRGRIELRSPYCDEATSRLVL